MRVKILSQKKKNESQNILTIQWESKYTQISFLDMIVFIFFPDYN